MSCKVTDCVATRMSLNVEINEGGQMIIPIEEISSFRTGF